MPEILPATRREGEQVITWIWKKNKKNYRLANTSFFTSRTQKNIEKVSAFDVKMSPVLKKWPTWPYFHFIFGLSDKCETQDLASHGDIWKPSINSLKCICRHRLTDLSSEYEFEVRQMNFYEIVKGATITAYVWLDIQYIDPYTDSSKSKIDWYLPAGWSNVRCWQVQRFLMLFLENRSKMFSKLQQSPNFHEFYHFWKCLGFLRRIAGFPPNLAPLSIILEKSWL
jgi:hypothetical protein